MLSMMKPTGSMDPFALMDDLRRSFWGEPFAPFATPAGPRIAADEAEGKLRLRLDVPGMRGEDLKVEAKDDALVLSGSRNVVSREGYRELRRERGEFRFSRRLRIGRDYDLDQATARFDAGVLTIEIPRRPELQPRQIPVEAVAAKSE